MWSNVEFHVLPVHRRRLGACIVVETAADSYVRPMSRKLSFHLRLPPKGPNDAGS